MQQGSSWENEKPEWRKVLLIHGKPGVGKTTLASIACKHAGYDPEEVNASEDVARRGVPSTVQPGIPGDYLCHN